MHKILLIEDDPVQSFVLATYLTRYCDAEVVTTTGETYMKQAASILPIDAVVMDWYAIPGYNGVSIIHNIRKMEPQVKILIYTSSLEKSDETSALSAGADKFIRKSGSMNELQHYLSVCFSYTE